MRGKNTSLVKEAVSGNGSFYIEGKLGSLLNLAASSIAGLVYAGEKYLSSYDKHFAKMVEYAGDEFKALSPQDKSKAKGFYLALAKHSPIVAKDHIAAWNHTRNFLANPTSYGAQSIEQLKRVESSGRKFFSR